MAGQVIAVAKDSSHRFSKIIMPEITIVAGPADVEGLITSRAEEAEIDLMTARDAWFGLLDPVEQHKGDEEILAYCSSPAGWKSDPQSDEKARWRQALYKLAGTYARAFAGVAEDPVASGVNELQLAQYRGEVEHAIALRNAVRLHSGDAVDMKQFEPAMRHLIDTYIKADESEVISHVDDISQIDLVASEGAAVGEGLPDPVKSKPENVAEAIENNVRRGRIAERQHRGRKRNGGSQKLSCEKPTLRTNPFSALRSCARPAS